MALPHASETCKILVPVHRRLDDFETQVVSHNLTVLSKYDAVLFGPDSKAQILAETAKDLCARAGTHVTIECFDDQYFNDVFGYSWLLLNKTFYARFEDVSHVLICQPDAFVLSADLAPWLSSGFSYLGAPVFKGFGKPVIPPEFLGLLNGGFSLRNVADAQAALSQTVLVKKSTLTRTLRVLGILTVANFVLRALGKSILPVPEKSHEDAIWTGPIAKAVGAFSLADLDSAARFAFEAVPSYLYDKYENKLPFGCHAFAVYEPDFWAQHLPQWTHEHIISERNP